MYIYHENVKFNITRVKPLINLGNSLTRPALAYDLH